MTKFSSLQILQSGSNPRQLNCKAFLDCKGLHLDYIDYRSNLSNQTAMSAIGLQLPQEDCNLSIHLASRAKYQQSESNPCILTHSCNLTHSIILVPLPCGRTQATSPTQGGMTNPIREFAISAISMQSPELDCNLNNQTAIPTIRPEVSE